MGWKGDGILSFVGHWEELAKFVVSAHLPVVEISTVRKDLGIPCVMEDNEAIGRLGAEHLLERNLKTFVWAPFWDDTVNEERFQGFANAIRSAGFDCVRLLPVKTRRRARLSRPMDRTLPRRWVIHTIRSLRFPLGIFCYNDCVAADIVDACIESGIRIPDEVAVLGGDNKPGNFGIVQVAPNRGRHAPGGKGY